MTDDLRLRFADALKRRLNPCSVNVASSVPTATNSLAPGVLDLADAVMAVRDEELERLKVVETASIGAHALLDDAEEALARVRALAERWCRESHPTHDHPCPDDLRRELLDALDDTEGTDRG